MLLLETETAVLAAQKARYHYNLGMAPLVNLRSFLEAQGLMIFIIPFGKEQNAISGLFLSHPKLGNIIAINQAQTDSRLSFSLAHGLAHRLYQYDQPAILCHHGVTNPLECFAERFAAYFLIPSAALQERLHSLGVKRVRHPAEVVHLAHYFGVSYEEMLVRLDLEHQLAGSQEDFKRIQPARLSRNLGYSSSFEESGEGFLPVEKRLPRIFLELAYRAVLADKLSRRRVAEMLGISDIELEDRLCTNEQTLEEIAS
ncbi:conserved domain protein [Coleofasciculus chthonoplastes PCC 7420]|uniref:Conserved domain protein n=1 Tax=Coleofasciculus chthonoplastes PCC 7420 TaxID=118168 RepID=B4W2P4_9CYAN|nr:ImmA/IrrE family metallo-endopeptidase [Coleofasciculus chthonoplastes]EDX71587.1 conserved domain protein [Coleofasciculus chthonoplastes PCC 7420]